MSEIIIQGRKVDTKDIWDLHLETGTREVYVLVSIIDRSPIKIGRHNPYETRQGQFQEYWEPYKKLYNSIKEKWDAYKLDIPVFKL